MPTETYLDIPDESPATTAEIIDSSRLVATHAGHIRTQIFNRGLLDRKDPLEAQGTELQQFSLSISYPVDGARLSPVIGDLFQRVTSSISGGKIPDTKVEFVDFKDVRVDEPARRYLVIDRDTPRETRTAVYATFQAFGENLYVSIDAFILPPLSVLRIVITALILLLLVPNVLAGFAFVGFTKTGLFLVAASLTWYFSNMIKSLRHGEHFGVALRKQFHKSLRLGTFNRDDVLKFYKSTLPLVFGCIHDVFEKYDIPVDVVDQAIQQIQFVTNISTGGGNVVGNVVNGVRHTVTGGGSTTKSD